MVTMLLLCFRADNAVTVVYKPPNTTPGVHEPPAVLMYTCYARIKSVSHLSCAPDDTLWKGS